MGGPGSGRRNAAAVRDQHNRILNPEDPQDLRQMALAHHSKLMEGALRKASRGEGMTADIAEIEQFEDACRNEAVCDFDDGSTTLIRLAVSVANKRIKYATE